MEDQESEQTQSNAEYDPSKLPARIIGKPFGKDNQPTGEQKSKGWMKKKRNRELAQYILQRSWKKNRMNNEIHEQMKEFFNITDEEIDELTYEGVVYLKQLALAINNGDMAAASQLMERAFGKPIQTIDFGGTDAPPPINIQVGNSNDVPPIEESENEETT